MAADKDIGLKAAVSEEPRGVLPAGTRLRAYEIVSVIGQGSFGITYLAHDTQLDRDVAIKEYLPTFLALRDAGTRVVPRSTEHAAAFVSGRARFLDEARTLAKLAHAPSIVRVLDFLEDNGTAYMVMALASGETLAQRLKREGALSPSHAKLLLQRLLDGLDQIHAIGFLHRDIKPPNIIVDDEGVPTLIDFGAARAAIVGGTSAMTAIFTPGYAAAEQFTSAKQGPWTDIYGLSATLYHAITGVPPPSAFDRMVSDDYEPLSKLMPPGFEPGLLTGIDAGLAVRANDRPQSIADWRTLLAQPDAVFSQATIVMPSSSGSAPAPAATVMQPPVPQKSDRRPWLAAATALVVALGIGGGYHLASRPTGPDPVAAETARKQQEAVEAEATKRRAMETELAGLRAEAAAREKLQAEAAARQKAEAETRLKARQEAARQTQIEEEKRLKAEAEAATAREKAEVEARQAAEAAETTMNLTLTDRQHIQVALTALGFDTNGTDGIIGTQTRRMIAAWQTARGALPTGFLSSPQNQSLLKEAAPAVSRFDDDRKKQSEAKRQADETAKPRTPAPPAPQSTQAAPKPVAGSVPTEPGPGAMKRGEIVLVDDGTCPADQIKQVTGGSNQQGIARTKKCIPRP